MNVRKIAALFTVALIGTIVFCACGRKKVSFSQEVSPILKKHCVGCHYPGNEFNQSQLVMNTYESLMQGGVHGSPVVPGNADSSLIIKKLGSSPPFGGQMPLMSKEKLSDDEVTLIAKWINQGANNN
jgi:mono/diheme cytochrome c family protein